jgi:hypothetical protein
VFWPTHLAQKFCAWPCRKAKLSDYDKRVIAQFRALCQKYQLSMSAVLTYITGRNFHGQALRRFYRPPHAAGRSMTPATKDRYMMMIAKFTRDFLNGWYDILPLSRTCANKVFKQVGRRSAPRQRDCPRGLPHCTGGLFPGDCPRRWGQCPLWITTS